MITIIKKHFKDAKMSRFWQLFTLFHIASTSLLFLFASDFLVHLMRPILSAAIVIGIASSLKHHDLTKQKLWLYLLAGTMLFMFSILLETLIYFNIPISYLIPFGIKATGILLTGIYGFLAIRLIEKNFNLEGLSIDLLLVILSVTTFIFIASPINIKSFLFEYSIIQQVYLINILVSIILVAIVLLHVILSKKFDLKSIVVVSLISFLTLHLLLELQLTFPNIENKKLLTRISWLLFFMAGSLTIIYSYLEKFDLVYSKQKTSNAGQLFMWSSSILALLVIPSAIFIHWLQETQSIFYLVVAISGIILSAIVISRFIVLIKDTNNQRKKLLNVLHTDELTGALNYIGCRKEYSHLALKNTLVITMNIDGFKSINELYGRDFGDTVLKRLADRLGQATNIVLFSRTGHDNFIAIFETSKKGIESQVKQLQTELGIWDEIMGHRIAVPLTFGASHSEEFIELENLIRKSEKALLEARNQCENVYLYKSSIDHKRIPRHELRGILQQAIDKSFLPVHFQPIYNLHDGSLKALELLVRLYSKNHGLLLPSQFLKQAQSYGLLAPLTKVCVKMLADNFDRLPDVTININLPPLMLGNTKVLDEFLSYFYEMKLPANRVCIEITEDENIPLEKLLVASKRLKDLGFAIAMDDFGTGYSSLTRLSTLPFDTIKIDRSVLLSSSENKDILESTITLIKRLGLSAVVEGVETLEQLKLIKLLGADSVQGFLLSKPVCIGEAINLPLNAHGIIKEF